VFRTHVNESNYLFQACKVDRSIKPFESASLICTSRNILSDTGYPCKYVGQYDDMSFGSDDVDLLEHITYRSKDTLTRNALAEKKKKPVYKLMANMSMYTTAAEMGFTTNTVNIHTLDRLHDASTIITFQNGRVSFVGDMPGWRYCKKESNNGCAPGLNPYGGSIPGLSMDPIICSGDPII
jgi:hypothetical protein